MLALALLLVVAPLSGVTVGEAETEGIYPLETDVKLTIWSKITSAASAYITSLSENATVIAYQEATGIDVEFIHPVAGQETESFNLLIAIGTYPDIMCASGYAGGVAAAVLDGVYADLTDYLPDYESNYWPFAENAPDFKKLASTEEGRFNTMYNYKNQYEPYYYRTQFREDYLEEFGMDIPVTLDEYEAYFEAVKTNHTDVITYTSMRTIRSTPCDGFSLYNDNILHNPELPMNNAEEILRLHGTGWARYRYGDKYCMATNQKDPEAGAYRERWGDEVTVDSAYAMPPFTLSAEASVLFRS